MTFWHLLHCPLLFSILSKLALLSRNSKIIDAFDINVDLIKSVKDTIVKPLMKAIYTAF